MKRLIMVGMMLISGLVQAEDGAVASTAPTATQSPSDTSSKSGGDSAIAIANVHQISLDTTEVDGGGNWLNKRIWYERSQTVFDEIRAMVNTVGDLRIQFSNEVNAIGRKIDTFFESVDFTKGQLDDKFKEILVALDTEKKMVGDLSPEERNLQTTIKQELAAIDQIGTDIKTIGDVDNKIDQTLMQAFKTIDECRDYETKAWDTFKSIGKELDDKKARNLYYQMNNYKQNIDQKTSYLKATLLPYLHNVLVAKIENNIAKITETIEALKTKGIDLEKIMSKSQEDDVTQLHAREKEAADIAVKKALEEAAIKSNEAAAKSAQELEEANNKSFSNVMNHYYEATIGKVVGFVHQGFVATAVDAVGEHVKSYSYPVATHLHHGVTAIREYMHHLVEYVMAYFGNKSAIKDVVKEKIAEKIEEKSAGGEHPAEKIADKIKEKIADKVAEHKPEHKEEKHSDVKAGETHAAATLDSHTKTPDTHAEKTAETASSVSPLTSSSSAETSQHSDSTSSSDKSAVDTKTATDASHEVSADKGVTVQSIKNDEDKHESVNSFYHVFKTVLDMIGTVLMSIYNCIVQFFKLLLSFSSYLSSAN